MKHSLSNKQGQQQKRILFVEDNLYLGNLYFVTLTNSGHLVDWVTNGEDALVKFLKNDYGVIITGLLMPKMNGIELLEKIHDSGKKHGTLIVFTALNLEEERKRALELGAAEYLIKEENSPYEMVKIVDRYLKTTKQ